MSDQTLEQTAIDVHDQVSTTSKRKKFRGLMNGRVAEPKVKFYLAITFYNPEQGNTFERTFPNGGRRDPYDDECMEREPVPQSWTDVCQLVDEFIEVSGYTPVAIKECSMGSVEKFQTDKMVPDVVQKSLIQQRYGTSEIEPIGQTMPQLAPGQNRLDPSFQAAMQNLGLGIQQLNPHQEQTLMNMPTPEMARTPGSTTLSPQAAALLAKMQQMSTGNG